ncbi:VWA domain-containing protein [Kitasatospora aureofaciens]|uniref:VWA domain-containing protein n=1 Tax=Kitasatospora aureofaciens TaxID=1894 RepID=UPI001C48790B|nr:VWA domain-containing protein [Kitasatospora aureofaciens]MBV6700242.1 VWA domain-containing protein [Kitasatospora aureofaciens]
MGKKLNKLKDLALRAGRWLAAAGAAVPGQASAVVSDRFDAMAWRELLDAAPALRELADDLGEQHNHVQDLLADVFLAAYKVPPRVRERSEMAPSRLVNHQVITSMLNSREFGELRRETAGDPYAAAMAVLAQASELRRLLEHARRAQEEARRAEDARQDAERAAREVGEAMERAAAAAGEDGTVPAPSAVEVERALRRAEAADEAARSAAGAAEAALASAAPGIRAAVRRAVSQAADAAREEAALMQAWGIGPGQLERMPAQQRARLAERLRTGRMARFAELIGRFRQMASGERARRVEHVPGELVGVTLGDDLTRVVPSEVAMLGTPALRAVFAARFAEQQLMLYENRGEQPAGQGAIIACIDCSASMAAPYGGSGITGEAWAKACALALLDQARKARRDFVGIHFSSAHEVKTYRFPAAAPADIGDVLDFAEHFWGGGTDYQAPLTEAVALLQDEYNTEGRQRGDIVFITDGECAVSENWMRRWNDARHELAHRTFGVAIGEPHAAEPGGILDALCDNVRTIDDLTDTRAAADLFRVI